MTVHEKFVEDMNGAGIDIEGLCGVWERRVAAERSPTNRTESCISPRTGAIIQPPFVVQR
jgi:hypothetical protein